MEMHDSLYEYIDLTSLKVETSESMVDDLVEIALKKKYYGICIGPQYVSKIKRSFIGIASPPKIVTVASFPWGFGDVDTKSTEIRNAIKNGADEIDLVVNISNVINGKWDKVNDEIEACVAATKNQNRLLKLIIEYNILPFQAIEPLLELCIKHKVDMVKTGTGTRGATTFDTVQKMRKLLPSHIGIKASGGVRNAELAASMIKAGATRIGTSSTW